MSNSNVYLLTHPHASLTLRTKENAPKFSSQQSKLNYTFSLLKVSGEIQPETLPFNSTFHTIIFSTLNILVS